MHKFEYRAPRYPVDLPVRLTLQNGVTSGRCLEISVDGMLAQFPEPLVLNSCGIVTLAWREHSVQIRAYVVHTGRDYDGLSFRFESERDRHSLERLVALISAPAPRLGPVLVR